MQFWHKALWAVVALALLAAGCAGEPAAQEEGAPPVSDVQQPSGEEATFEEVLQLVEPHLEGALLQEAEAYPSEDAFWQANLGLDEGSVAQGVLYLGAPNQNTTFFALLRKTPEADAQQMLGQLESRLQAHVETAEMGYMQGNREYTVVQKGDLLVAWMHEDPAQYEEVAEALAAL